MSAQDDLTYVREMAERGANGPLGGGRILLWWGSLITLALFVHYALQSGMVAAPNWSYFALWGAMVTLGWGGTYTFLGRSRDASGTLTHATLTNAAVWRAAGLFLTFFAFAIVARQVTQPLDTHLFDLIVVVGTGVYGIAFATTASVAEKRWLWGFAILAFGLSGLYVFMLGTAELYLFAAIGTAAIIALPGLLMMRAS